jgi:hypothetical protein
LLKLLTLVSHPSQEAKTLLKIMFEVYRLKKTFLKSVVDVLRAFGLLQVNILEFFQILS